MKRFTGQYAHG